MERLPRLAPCRETSRPEFLLMFRCSLSRETSSPRLVDPRRDCASRLSREPPMNGVISEVMSRNTA